MTDVAWSTWSTAEPRVDGSIVDGEWSGAGAVALPADPAGTVLVQNDARFLSIAIDVPEDTEPSPDPPDYFWFSVDVDQDGMITPNVDVNDGQAMGARTGPSRLLRRAPYLFRLRAAMPVTNGYTPYFGGAETFKTLTLVRS